MITTSNFMAMARDSRTRGTVYRVAASQRRWPLIVFIANRLQQLRARQPRLAAKGDRAALEMQYRLVFDSEAQQTLRTAAEWRDS